jgi:pimeloyl-ACP methyl ester carboxylesterase
MSLRLDPIVDGNEAGDPILFVQGWPDDATLWDEAVRAVGGRYRCIRVNLPGYGGTPASRWGHDTEEIVDALVRLIREVGASRPVTLVLHDWGCYWGHAAHHRCGDVVGRVASLDVAPHYKPSPAAAAGIVAYQGWLLGAFVLGGGLGDRMTRGFARLAGAPGDTKRVHARMNYPYRNVWADLVSGRAAELTRGYWPTCPLLFAYGGRKPYAFHSQAWLDHVRRVGGEVVRLESGHWLTTDPGFVPMLSRWLDATEAQVDGARSGLRSSDSVARG